MFTGYGGLDMAVLAHFGGTLAWYAEVEPAACRVLAAHHPGVPNLGDVTVVDWSAVEAVDAITAGYPCQPFSHAGKRKGKNDERHLWPYVRDAIGAMGPGIVVLENVAGHLSMGLADVIGDLAGLGYDARWGVVRASDAGAPHQRARVFIVADAGSRPLPRPAAAGVGLPEPAERGTEPAADANGSGSEARLYPGPDGERLRVQPVGLANIAWHADSGNVASEPAGDQQESKPSRDRINGGSGAVDWGLYEPAIRRWERLTRPVPAPTVQHNGRHRLSPAFVEWMMGLPEGHVTGHGLSSAQALKMLGNGVVPQQARLALGLLT